MSRQGNQNHYQANANNPIFKRIKGDHPKNFWGSGNYQRSASTTVATVKLCFIYGSVAQGREHAGSDIDLMLVGDGMSYSEEMELLAPAEKRLGRTINPTLYTVAEFTDRKNTHQPIFTSVIEQPNCG